jgi:DedD protein
MNKNISEEELLLRKRARRRLVGAIVLVLISVIVLPAIFDEPKPENEKHEIVINLPPSSKNTQGDSVSLPKEESINRESLNVAEVSAEMQSKSKTNLQNIEETIETFSEQKRIPIPGIKPKIDRRPIPIETKSTTVINTANTPNTTAVATNAAATAVVAATAAVPADTARAFVVQLGAFSDQSKAKQQLTSLLSNGFKAYTETVKVDNNEITRVRIGPFMTRSAAENELKKLKKIGLDGVVAPR